MTAHKIGRGVVVWNGRERRTDRYGAVGLMAEDGDPDTGPHDLGGMAGKPGKLIAVVVQPRPSNHIGDIFRGLFQKELPAEGQRIELGDGYLFEEKIYGFDYVGVSPVDNRKNDWLDPAALYSVHNSVVDLIFEEST